MKHSFPFIFIIIVFNYLFCSCSADQSESPLLEHNNFVILFADDLGYGDLSCYGNPLINTPHLDKMANEGMKFTSFYAGAPVCTPSRAALLIGRYAARINLPNVLGPDSENGIDPEEITIAEALKDLGYRTKAIGKWHLGSTLDEHFPTANGFDSYFGLLYSNDMKPPWVKTDRPLSLYDNTEPIEHPVDQSKLTVRYTKQAIDFIQQNKSEAFFLYLAYSMPHLPVFTIDSMQGRSLAGRYGDVIETIDWSAGEILSTLKSNGLDKNTLVIFTSDNGPWLGLPDRMLQEGNQRWHAGSPGLLRGWKGQTYEGGIRVPAIFWWPEIIPPGRRSAEIVSVLDLFPTIVSAAGGDIPDDRVYDGNNLMPLISGQTNESPAERFFYFRSDRVQAVRVGPWKLRVVNEDAEPELFHLNLDPSERYNRAREFPEKVESLSTQIEKMQMSMPVNP